MSGIIINRTKTNRGKSAENRNKLIRRVRDALKKSLPDLTRNRGLQDFDKGGRVRIPKKTLNEPHFTHDRSDGEFDVVAPGNKQYTTGDQIPRPKGGGQGQGKNASDSGEGEDDFIVELNREEFLDLFFDGLELPDLVKKDLFNVVEVEHHNAGFTSTGSPAKLSIVKTLKNSHARRIVSKGVREKKIQELEVQLAEYPEDEVLKKKLEDLKSKKDRFLEENDLRYHATVDEIHPTTSATMMLIQDVSGSMGQFEKTIARKFFYLMYIFLKKHYQKINLYFIIHTTDAQEVEENEFFETTKNGGTVVSTALKLANEIIERDGLDKTNIYVSQVSDGDTWPGDSTTVEQQMKVLASRSQYVAYAEVRSEPSRDVTLKQIYDDLGSSNLQTALIDDENQIFSVFRKLFSSGGKDD